VTFRPTVYVSSTFEDLKTQRSRVLKAVAVAEATAIAMEFYGAMDAAALEKCVDDVKKCNLYVGIIGWKYGYVPEGSSISITESEFDAAVSAGIPKLIYLVPDASRPPDVGADDPISRFRERASKNLMRRTFEDEADLAMWVGRDVSREVDLLVAKNAADSLLPYLCDRNDQTETIGFSISEPAGTGPPVCLLHGTGNQSPLRFLDCLKRYHLPECLGLSGQPASEIDLPWPAGAANVVARSVRLALARALSLDVRRDAAALEASVRRKMAEFPGPVLVTFVAPTLTAVDLERLRGVVGYFKEWPLAELKKPDLVVVSVVHPASRAGSTDDRQQRSRETVAGIEQSETRLQVLPELADVGLPDASRWTRLEQLGGLALQSDLESQVRELFDGDDTLRIPMADLAPKLLELLTKAVTRSRP
jgi:hypothetical protein